MRIKKFRKRMLVKTTIIAGISFFGLILPKIVWAAIFPTPSEIAKGMLQWIVNLILSLFGFLVGLSAKFFDTMLSIGFNKNQEIVEIGWKVTRDFSNMLFILFMVIIAFATILRLQQYGIKQLLPKVIIIALLINFSLVISYVIIDFSNITADFFIEDAKEKSMADKDGNKSISATIADSLNLSKTILPFDCSEYDEGDAKKRCGLIFPDKDEETEKNKCIYENRRLKLECDKKEDQMKKVANTEQSFMNMLISGILSAMILSVAAFVLFAGGILLVIRILFLWFLVMMVPLVFICYIMPGLRQNWQKWWKSFLSWCFFAPIYAFFIWLAVGIARARKIERMKDFETAINTSDPQMINQFFSNSDTIISFIFIIGLLVGGLIAAKQFGIAGANTAMTIGQKWYKGAGRGISKWGLARTRERTARPLQGVAKGTAWLYGKTLGKIPGIKELGIGKIAQAPAQVMREQLKGIEAEKKKLSSYSPNALKSLYSTFDRTQQIATAQLLAEKDKLSPEHGFTIKEMEKITKIASIYKAEGPILDKKPGLAPMAGKTIKETVEKGVAKKDHQKYTKEVFEDPNGDKVADALISLTKDSVSDFVKLFKELRKDAQEALKGRLKNKFTDDFKNPNNVKNRERYAAVTGELDVAFTKSDKITIDDDTLGNFVKDMRPNNYADLSPKAVPAVAKHIDASTAREIVKHLSREMKQKFADNFTKEVKDDLAEDNRWKNFIKKEPELDQQKAREEKAINDARRTIDLRKKKE